MRDSRWVSLVALFTAMAVVLNGFTVPAPFAGFLLYGVWEVPVLLALLLLGFRGGLVVAALNALALEFINPGGLPTGPLYNLFAEISTFCGVLVASRAASGKGPFALVGSATALAAVFRTGVMTVVNGLVLPQPYPVGFSIPEAAVPGFLVLIAIFNASVTLYVVPTSYGIRNAIASRSRTVNHLPGEGLTS